MAGLQPAVFAWRAPDRMCSARWSLALTPELQPQVAGPVAYEPSHVYSTMYRIVRSRSNFTFADAPFSGHMYKEPAVPVSPRTSSARIPVSSIVPVAAYRPRISG